MKKRILTLTPFLWSGAGKAIIRLIREFSARGIECEMISSGSSRGMVDWPEYVRELKRAQIPHHRIDFFDRDSARIWQSIVELSDLLRKRAYDLIHVHSGVPAFASVAARERAGRNLPVVATFHSWNPDRPSWMNHADVWSLNRCDRVVTDSQSYYELLSKWGLQLEKASVIYPGIDSPRSNPGRRLSRKNGTFRIFSVGRIEPRKDQETILRAFSGLVRKIPEAELFLVGPPGDEDYHRALLRKAERYGWQRNVRFLGKVRDVDRWYRCADLFVSASRDEGLGLSLLEAMSFGIPTISTPVNGHSDFAFEGQNTRHFPPGDHQALESAMFALFLDPVLRKNLGTSGRETVKQMFSWGRAARSYMRIFRDLW